MQRIHFEKLMVGGALIAAMGLVAGCDKEKTVTPEDFEDADLFESVDFTVDSKNHEILLSEEEDSLVVGSLEALGGAKYFVATDDDPVDPAFDWDEELSEGSVIALNDTNSVRIVVLDEQNRTVAVWTVSYEEEKSSSSKAKSSSSSEEESSDSDNDESSSSEEIVEESSSSEEDAESSSSEVAESSSSEEFDESSSSVEPESSSSEETEESSSSEAIAINVNDLTVDGGVVTVSESKVYVEMPYGSDLSKIKFDQIDTTNNLIHPVDMKFESDGENKVFSVVAGVQLPGSSFDSWDKTFWGSTSDAMATEGTGTYTVLLFDVDVSMKSDSANAYFTDGKMTLITQSVVGHSTGFDGGWKMAGGFYFAGSYTGTDAASIYQADNSDAGANNRPADFSQYMKFGRPFTARPVSFDVTYAYTHKDNTNDTYPQSSLIYVVLVSANNKIVAAGKISDNASVDMNTKTVELKYGDDAGLIASNAIGVSGLSKGTGDEDVATIRVMLVSSALAYVADGGTSSQMKKNFRGGEGSQLIIDEFKLNY